MSLPLASPLASLLFIDSEANRVRYQIIRSLGVACALPLSLSKTEYVVLDSECQMFVSIGRKGTVTALRLVL